MRIALGSDEETPLTNLIRDYLEGKGHQVELVGPLRGEQSEWPVVAREVAVRVSEGICEQGVLLCWTGTGVSIAANKFPGVRAALCTDSETARGARRWNHANVLCLSLRLTSSNIAREIIGAWFSEPEDPTEIGNIRKVCELEQLAVNPVRS